MAKDGYSRKGFFGETIHYNANGQKVGESTPNFWGGSNYHSSGSENSRISYPVLDDDHDAIQDEVDCFDDPDEAIAWLEDEGYDPDDFDL